MELQEFRYYNLNKFSNTQYLVMAELKKYFANNVFRGNLDRVIYASSDYMFRQRLNLLSKNNASSIEALDVPFMSYYRQDNWKLDTRPANLNGFNALWGRPDDIIGGQRLRYMPMEQTFECIAVFGNDVDAQLAYESLLFIQYPTEKMIISEGLEYKGYKVPIYVGVSVKDIQFNQGYNETKWLKENRIIPIRFSVTARSVVLSQAPQGPESDVFDDDSLPTLTERVYLDFLSYQGQDNQWLKENIVMMVEGIINPDPSLSATLVVDDISENAISVAWDYNESSISLYQPTVKIWYNNNEPIERPIESKFYLFDDLVEGSFYTITLAFTALTGEIYKYTVTATTSGNAQIKLKGMKG